HRLLVLAELCNNDSASCSLAFSELVVLLFTRPDHHADLHSFPTRRSSDLFERVVEVLTYGAEKYTVYGDCTCNLPNTGHAASCQDRKSTRLNSSHVKISYAVFCLKKKSNKYLLADTCVVSAKHSHTEDEAF